ncbi:hypothetical protein ColTof4_12322 [Colletotrichum tofieldiae]|uniref:Transmembrane protein n=1 Tax=Colletotrichum tofieldiae TaxID=708197 RepID=A0A166YA95_9PEZI|nr:hypothetical protein CT0861_02447 [Colletotrichum tofieldiae]GKT58391.1 hypothetical protein ColTof3_05730 [Colletotrichum tofieldiae]GKT79899.1 hypothetical protein ColTof4_12322 [Colletotrichum tofieldiae]GKT84474.1 hypothetical protein Ct61P_02324 [Colletotrichum tofieldiae]
MRSESASAIGLLAGMLAAAGPAAARPDVYARSQQMRRQNAQDCLEDLEDILDNAPTTSMSWGATACDYTSTLSGAELSATYASFRNRMSSWYTDDLDDITKLEASCTQYASVFSQIRYCYVTGPVPTAAAATTSSSTVATTTSPSTGGISTATVTTTATPDGDNGMDDGTKAGLAIGIILAVLLLMFIGYKMFMKHRAKQLDAAATTANGNIGPEMGVAGAAGAIGVAAAKSGPEENTVHAYKSELNGESRPVPELDPRSISELDPSAAVAVPRTTGVHRHFAELDPNPPTQLSELPADNYDPTLDTNSPPPAYVSPVTESGTRNTLYSVVSPVSPDSSTMQSHHGLGISTVSEGDSSPGANGNSGAWTDQDSTVQQGFGRGWLPKAQ